MLPLSLDPLLMEVVILARYQANLMPTLASKSQPEPMRFPTGGRLRGCLVRRSGQDVALGREPGIPHGSPGVRYLPVPLSQSQRPRA
jgi:hypothetical protein